MNMQMAVNKVQSSEPMKKPQPDKLQDNYTLAIRDIKQDQVELQ